MESDPDNTQIGLSTNQTALLLERLEALRGELGVVGEELITLLRDAGVSTRSEPNSVPIDEAGQ